MFQSPASSVITSKTTWSPHKDQIVSSYYSISTKIGLFYEIIK